MDQCKPLVMVFSLTVYSYALGEVSAAVMKQDDEMIKVERCRLTLSNPS